MKRDIKITIVVGVFFLILAIILSLFISFLSLGLRALFFCIAILIAWLIYDKYLIELMNLKYVWWSPHRKKIILEIDREDFFPEMGILSYFLEKEYNSYQRWKTKDGFWITGAKNDTKLFAKQKKNSLIVTFHPTISKKTISIMKDFEKYIKNIEVIKD